MYLRYTTRKKDGKVHRTWRLVRSVRIGRRVIQQTVAHLGELDEAGRVRARALARALVGEPEQASLFDDGTRSQAIAVQLKGVRIENGRQFGQVYLAQALWRACRLDEFAAEHIAAGKEVVPWEKMAAVLVAARLCEPSSELHIAEDWDRRTALSDLQQMSEALVNKDRLYRALDQLLAHKGALEAHLSRRVGELFAVDNDVLLYDVTSSYFEGQAEGNAQARAAATRAIIAPIANRCASRWWSPSMASRSATKCSRATRTTPPPCRESSRPWKRDMGRWARCGSWITAWRVRCPNGPERARCAPRHRSDHQCGRPSPRG
jgi:hypothetical protein